MLDREPEAFVYKDPGILIVDTLRARFTAPINWAALFLLREPPIRLDVNAERHRAPD